ncbi:uncharacterized protein [Anabrus simplex]|uniref:uncharacterized protein n=1 Tax=Anabrus simplex TaxID=316456 RepID=UPI0035A3C1D2
MDLEVKVKEEPICFEETSNTSCDNYKIISQEMHLKEEPKSDLAVPRETQPSSDVKNEISVDEHPVRQLVACFKEEDKMRKVVSSEVSSLATRGHTYRRASIFV